MKAGDARVLARARQTLEIEAEAIRRLAPRLGKDFLAAVRLLSECRCKVVLTGVGKSGLIAKKIAATLASTGTPSVFLHAAEGAHGDLGVVTPGDVVVAVSTSGETVEILRLLPALRQIGTAVVALTSLRDSRLAKASTVVLLTGRAREACPLGLAPTTSSTVALALGDALAMALLEHRGFSEEDFARLHPGGKLGTRWLRVADLMHRGADLPLARAKTPLLRAVYIMSSRKLGIAAVVDARRRLSGVVTDGDLRRMIERGIDFSKARVGEVMTRDPVTIDEQEYGVQALRLMESRSITSLAVTDAAGRLKGLLHLHDLLKAGIA
ncbi:MAG: KpsF/GutQ family sugar-phosphate isomerase [Candidatus Methylomirabilia bacterium]